MWRTILLFGAAREASSRCENKMLRPFVGTTLFDIHLEGLAALWETGLFADWGVAVARCDGELWVKASASGVPVIERSAESVARGVLPRGRELHFLDQFSTTHALCLNGCMPFFRTDWVEDAVRRFLYDDAMSSMTCKRIEHDWFWRLDGAPVNNPDPRCISTQGCEPLLRSVHAFNIYPRERMLKENVRWLLEPGDPADYVLDEDGDELLDVDTEEGFLRCEDAWKRRSEVVRKER